MDAGYITYNTVTSGSYGEVENTQTTGSTIQCGFMWVGGKESWRDPVNVLNIDAVLRLPVDTDIDSTCNFTLSKRFNETIAVPIAFDVVSNARIGISGVVVDLKKVVV